MNSTPETSPEDRGWRWLHAYIGGVVRHPWLTLSVVAVLTAILAIGLGRLRTEVNFDERELPADDVHVKNCNRLEKVFGKFSPVTMVFEVPKGDSVFRPEHLRTIRDLSNRLSRNKQLIPNDVASLTEVSDVTLSHDSMDSRKIVQFPVGEGDVNGIRDRIRSNEMWANRLVDADGRTTLLISSSTLGLSADVLYDDLQRMIAEVKPPVRAMVTGMDVLPVVMTRAIRQDLNLFIPLALVFVAIGFLISFRTLGGVVLPLVSAFLPLIWTLGLMGWFGVAINPVTNVIPAAMVAIASSYGIHLMSRYYQAQAAGYRGRDAVYQAGRVVSRPLLLAGATSAVGLITLITFEIQMIRQFGIFIAIGVVIAAVHTLTVIPALLSLHPAVNPGKPRQRWLSNRALPRLGVFLFSHPWLILGSVLVIGMTCFVSISRIKVGIDLPSYFSTGHEQRLATRLIADRLGGAAEVALMVTVKKDVFPGGTRSPQLLQKLMAFEDRVRKIEGIGHVQSLADVVFHVYKRVRQGLMADGSESGKLALASARGPENRDQVDQLILLFSLGSGMYSIDRLEDSTQTHLAVRVALKSWDPLEHGLIIEEMHKLFRSSFPRGAELVAGGSAVLTRAFDRYIIEGKLLNALYSILGVFFCCALVYRSLRQGLYCLIPVIFTTVVTFGLMAALGTRLTMATAVISAIAIGVGVDFAIHFLDYYRSRLGKGVSAESAVIDTMSEVGPAVIYDAGSNILGFLPLALSSLVPVREFSLLITFCMMFSAVATLIIMPAVAKVTVRSTMWKLKVIHESNFKEAIQ